MRRIARLSIWIAAGVLLAACLAAIVGIAALRWARSPAGREAIRVAIVSQAQQRLDGKVAIDRVDGDLLRGIVLRNVRFFDARGQLAFGAPALEVRYDLLGLLRREVRIEALTVEGANLRARFPGGRSAGAPGVPSTPVPRGFTIVVRSVRLDSEVLVDGTPLGDLRGNLSLDGSARLQGDRGEARITRMIFAARTPRPLRTEAAGNIRWDERGPHLEELRIHAIAAGPTEATLRIEGNRQGLDAEIALSPPTGSLHATARAAQESSGEWAWSAEVSARDLDPAIVGHSVPHGVVELAVRAHGEGTRFSLAIDRMYARASGAVFFTHGIVAMDPSLSGDLRIVARASDLSRLERVGLPRLGGSFAARAHLYGNSLSHTDAVFDGKQLQFRGTRVASAHAELRRVGSGGDLLLTTGAIEHPLLQITTLRFTAAHRDSRVAAALLACGPRGTVARLRAHGVSRRDRGAWGLDAVLDDLLLAALGETVHLDGPGHLRIDRDRIHGHLALAARAQHLFLDGDFDRARKTIALGVHGDRLQLGHLARRFVPLPIEKGIGALTATLHGTLRAPDARLRVEARGWKIGTFDQVDFSVDGHYAGGHAISHVEAQLRGAPILDASAEASLDPLVLLRHRDWRNLPILVEANVPAYDLSRLPKLGGTIDGSVDLHGTLAHPLGSAIFHARDLTVARNHLGSGDLHAIFDGEAISASVDAIPQRGGFHLAAHAPLDPNAPLHATVSAGELAFDLHDLGNLHRLHGKLNAHFEVGGTRAHPWLSGASTFTGGTLILASDPRPLHEITVDLLAHDHSIELHAMKLRIGEGSVTAHGAVVFEGLHPAAIDLVADARRLPFQASEPEAWVSLRTELHARTEEGQLRGSLTISDGRAELAGIEELARHLQPIGPLEDVVFHGGAAPPRHRARRALATVEADLVAHLPGPFRVRASDLTADLQGELDVRAGRDGLRLSGHAETMSGQIEILRRRWEIEHAQIRFDGGPEIDPRLDVRVTRHTGDANVVIEVHGTKSHPELLLTSEPPIYDTTQIIGIIVAGDPTQHQVSPPTLESHMAGAVSGILVARLLDQVVPWLPIDVLRVETANVGQDPSRHTRLEVGRYLGERLYVSYVHRFGTNAGGLERVNSVEANLEYRFAHRATLRLRYGDAQVGAIEMAWWFRY
jgi:hypothetical protein